MDERCEACMLPEHISQEACFVTKHEHMGYQPGVYPCDKPWSAGCQTDHGSLCFIGDYETQAEAVRAMDEHLRAGVHLGVCLADNKPVQKCAIRAGKEKKDE